MAPKLYTALDTERLLKNFEKHFNQMAGALEKQRQALKTVCDVCASQQDLIDKLHARLRAVETVCAALEKEPTPKAETFEQFKALLAAQGVSLDELLKHSLNVCPTCKRASHQSQDVGNGMIEVPEGHENDERSDER